VCAGAEEEVPDDCPELLGKEVVMTTFVDANLYHDLVNAPLQQDGHRLVFQEASYS
jgi:hypothetical protein